MTKVQDFETRDQAKAWIREHFGSDVEIQDPEVFTIAVLKSHITGDKNSKRLVGQVAQLVRARMDGPKGYVTEVGGSNPSLPILIHALRFCSDEWDFTGCDITGIILV